MSHSPRFPADLAACHELLAAWSATMQTHEATIRDHEVTVRTHELTIAGMNEQLAARDAKIAKQQAELAEKQLQINELMRRAYQKRRERYHDNPDQLRIDFGDTPEAANAAEGLAEAIVESEQAAAEIVVPEHTRRRHAPRKARNEKLPPHLPRYTVDAPISDAAKTCPTHGEKKLIGYDEQETLEFLPPKLQVRVTRIPKFACVNQPATTCEATAHPTVVAAPVAATSTANESAPHIRLASECGVTEGLRPIGLIEGNKYDTSIAAEIITAKYGYHLPIYRQQDLFASSGWTPTRSTLLNIATAAAELLPPFIEFLRDEVRRDFGIGTDDTRVTLLLPPGDFVPAPGETRKSQRIHEVFAEAREKQEPSVTARFWAYRGITVPINVFDFTVSRHRDGPDDFLVEPNFTGTLLADCYSGYQCITLRSESRIARAACNAHARRKFFDARDNHPLLANQFLALYQQLYDIEDRGRPLSPADRLPLRAAEAEPVWKKLRELLDSELASRVLPKEKIAEALNYLRNHWDALRTYLTDGRLPVDNNLVEQLMKQVAVGRKNWLFVGSVAAGERAADFLTLVSSALRNDLDPYDYVKGVLDALLTGTRDFAALRPDTWAAAHPESVRVYRQRERTARAARKTTRRAARRRSR